MTPKIPKSAPLTPTMAHEIATEITQSDSRAVAKIGSHVTNGKKRLAVHVTYPTGEAKPYTIGSA